VIPQFSSLRQSADHRLSGVGEAPDRIRELHQFRKSPTARRRMLVPATAANPGTSSSTSRLQKEGKKPSQQKRVISEGPIPEGHQL